jgi:hypothetical protein
MNVRPPRTTVHRFEAGYGLLLVVFLTTLLLILAVGVAPNIFTEGKREQEKEMIWRGKQYARGVKLYYRKLGRFPTSLDDLTKPKTGSLRFMRQAYKDPMNKTDGSWRFIYVGAAGQLIGSLKPAQQNVQLPQAGGIGTPAGALGTVGGAGANGPLGTQLGPGGALGGTTLGSNAPGSIGARVSADQSDTGSNPQAIPTGDTPSIVGGNIIGVGSKINKRSVIVYDRAKNYRLFEFIWDPSRDNVGVGQPGLQTGTGLGQIPGQSPIGQPPGQQPGQSPFGAPQNPPQNPPQNQQ